jgi:hypothetical protein
VLYRISDVGNQISDELYIKYDLTGQTL